MSSKILAFSNHDQNFYDISKLTYNHNKHYFSRFDIEYKVYNNDEMVAQHGGDHTKGYYTKWIILLKLLEERPDIDYFFAIDTDIVICNFGFDMRHFTKMSDRDILWCTVDSCSENTYWNINAGSVLVKNSDASRNFFRYLIATAKSNNFRAVDQVVIQTMLRQLQAVRDITGIFPCNAFNHGNSSAFLYHDCGTSTSNQPLQKCLVEKYKNLSKVIESKKASYELRR